MRFSLDNFRSPAALARFVLTCAIGLALDLWTKALAVRHLKNSHSVQFLPSWLHFDYVENQGAVFGLGQGQRVFFIVISILATGFLTFLFATSHRSHRFYQVLLGMLLAGVLGNMYDRIVFGHVRDMLHALPGWHNPFRFLYDSHEIFPWVFNIADSLLCVGVALMLIYSFIYRHDTFEEQAASISATPPERR